VCVKYVFVCVCVCVCVCPKNFQALYCIVRTFCFRQDVRVHLLFKTLNMYSSIQILLALFTTFSACQPLKLQLSYYSGTCTIFIDLTCYILRITIWETRSFFELCYLMTAHLWPLIQSTKVCWSLALSNVPYWECLPSHMLPDDGDKLNLKCSNFRILYYALSQPMDKSS